jgi:hypothetical protein
MFLLPAPFTWETNVQLPEILMPDHLFSHLTDFNPFSQMIFVFGTTSLLHHGFGKRPYLQIPDVVFFYFSFYFALCFFPGDCVCQLLFTFLILIHIKSRGLPLLLQKKRVQLVNIPIVVSHARLKKWHHCSGPAHVQSLHS